MSTASSPAPEQSHASLTPAKRVAFSLIVLVLLFVALELGANWYLRAAKGYAGGEFMQYQFDPYKNILLTPDWRDTRGVTHNAQGFRRVSLVAQPKPDSVYRIFLMGASTAYGLGGMWPHLQTEFEVLDDSTTIDRYLEQLLADAFPGRRVEVVNAGIPSIWTHHHLIYLNQSILSYRPDMILFLDGWNDHFFFDPAHDQFRSYVQTEQAHRIMASPTLSSLARMNGWWLFRKSAFFHVLGRTARSVAPLLRGRSAPAPIDVDLALRNVVDVFDRNARKMIDRNALMLEAERIPTLFMLQPMLALERDRLARMPEVEQRLFAFNLSAERPGYEAFITRATPLISARVRETVARRGSSFLDLTGIYRESPVQIFTDYAHLTPTGNRLLAEHIVPEILRLAASRVAAPLTTIR